jgi:arylsulfatase A-like enzyme
MTDNPASKPNVILIMADQLRADALSCMGNRILRTPNIDRIASAGVVFDQAFTNCPVCMASRAAIHTGRYPRSLRMRSMGMILPPDEITIAETLKRAGYRTGHFGKLHFLPMEYTWSKLNTDYDQDDPAPFLQPTGILSEATKAAAADPSKQRYGFDVSVPIGDLTWGHYRDWLEKISPEHLKHHVAENWGKGRAGLKFGASPPATRIFHPMVSDFFDSHLPAEIHPSYFIVQKAIEFIRENVHRPFFADLSFVDPHHPFNAPMPFNKMYPPSQMPIPPHFDREKCYPPGLPPGLSAVIQKQAAYPDELWQWALGNYFGMIANIDCCIGKLLDELEKLELADNTIILFTADHGEHVGDHRMLYKGSLLFDPLIRIPLLISWGTNLTPARRDALVQEIDLYPTVMSLLGLPIHPGVQGKDLSPILRGQTGSGYDLVTCELDDLPDPQYVSTLAIRSPECKLIYYPFARTGMLFNLMDDPGELRNLFFDASSRIIRDEMLLNLLDHLHRSKDPLPIRLSQA